LEEQPVDQVVAIQKILQGSPHPNVIEGWRARVQRDAKDASRVVVEDLRLLNEPSLNFVEVHLLDPLACDADVVKVEIAFLEHFEHQILVTNDDVPDLVEVVDTDVATLLLSPIIVASPEGDRFPFDD